MLRKNAVIYKFWCKRWVLITAALGTRPCQPPRLLAWSSAPSTIISWDSLTRFGSLDALYRWDISLSN